MKTYGLQDDQGNMVAFEVNNFGFFPSHVCSLVSRIPGAKVLRGPSGFLPEDLCEFEFDGIVFLVSEPFGDNSRYWVGPKSPAPGVPQLEIVRTAFAGARRVWDFLPWRQKP